MKQFAFFAAAMVLAAGAAEAKPPRNAEAVLASAPNALSETIIDGRVWRCLGTGCRGRVAGEPTSQPPDRECRRVAARLGELAHYRTGGRTFTAAELAACNTAAPKRTSDTALAGAR